jgi:hypothetical protein
MFLFHTIELMHCKRHPRPTQIMYKQVPVFQAMPYKLKTGAPITRTLLRTFKVPVEGNSTQHETNEREGSVNSIGRGRHYGPRMRRNLRHSRRELCWAYELPEGTTGDPVAFSNVGFKNSNSDIVDLGRHHRHDSYLMYSTLRVR